MSDPDFDFSFNKIDYIAHREAHDASAILLAFVAVLWFMIGMAIPSPYGDWILLGPPLVFFGGSFFGGLAIIIITPIACLIHGLYKDLKIISRKIKMGCKK